MFGCKWRRIAEAHYTAAVCDLPTGRQAQPWLHNNSKAWLKIVLLKMRMLVKSITFVLTSAQWFFLINIALLPTDKQ